MARTGTKIIKILVLAAAVVTNTAASLIVQDALVDAEWVATTLSKAGYRFDFSLESLKEIDRFLDEQAPNGAPRPGGILSKDLSIRVFALGAYVGEVIRRKAGGEWEGNDSDRLAPLNIAVRLKSGTVFWPVQRVIKRMKNGKEDEIYFYGIALIEHTQ